MQCIITSIRSLNRNILCHKIGAFKEQNIWEIGFSQHIIRYFGHILMCSFDGVTSCHQILIVVNSNFYTSFNIVDILALELCFGYDHNMPLTIVIFHFDKTAIRLNSCTWKKESPAQVFVYCV